MKVLPPFLPVLAGLAISMVFSAGAAPDLAKWGPGCDKALLEGEFSLTKAPEIKCPEERKAFIDQVIGEVKEGYGGTMVVTDSPHPHMDTPEFVAFYLRAFASPEQKLDSYDYRFERLLSRVSRHMAMIEDPRLDWDLWRAWLLFENTANSSSYYESEMKIDNRNVMNGLDGARELLWAYLDHNAPAILKDEKRRAWWLAHLTEDMEAPGGRPQRRWYLLSLLCAADPKRPALEKIRVKEKTVDAPFGGGKISVRQPGPLDPFLLVTGKKPVVPAFGEALAKMALGNHLSLTVLEADPATQPATRVPVISLEMTKYPTDSTAVINQESWSTPVKGKDGEEDPYWGYEWGVRFSRPVGRRDSFSSVSFPEDRTDGVYFFVFNQRLHVWPKARMDAAVIQMLRTGNLLDAAMASDLEKRGFPPLKSTLVKERPVK